MRGKFITMEGLDGAGKTVATDAVVEAIVNAGFEVMTTREVGGTPIGEEIRKLVLSKDSHILPNTEVLLMFAARSQHLEEVIVPALKEGRWIVCDRFTDSTYAYQGGGRGVAFDRIGLIEDWTQERFRPDLTLFLDADINTARRRVRQADSPDRFENETAEFHSRVRLAFIELLELHPDRIKRIDATQDVDEVKAEAQLHISDFIERTLDVRS